MFEDSFFLVDDNETLLFYPNLSMDARYKITLPETLTDIALSPEGRLFGVSFDTLYEIDIGSSTVSRVADLGVSSANAMEISPSGIAYIANAFEDGLHTVDLTDGSTTRIGGTYNSAGDLLFTTDGTLLLSTGDSRLVTLDPATGLELASSDHSLRNLYGLAEIDDEIIAFSLDDAYRFDFDTDTATLIRDFSADDVGSVNGGTGSLSFDAGRALSETDARVVAYLYEAGLDRDGNIDASGLNFWIDARESGLSEKQLAGAFLGSPEFAASFGDPDTLSDLDLVQRLYENVLDRAGERAGVDFWTGVVGRDDFDRDDLLAAFARSPENVEGSRFVDSLEQVSPGFWDFGVA